MSKRAITEIENKSKKILAARATETADLEGRLYKAKMQKEKACKALEEATILGDVKAYQKAKSERNDADDAIEMHTKRLETLNNRTLISKREYENGVNQIIEALDEVNTEAKKRIVEHMEQIRSIVKDWTTEIETGNKVLKQWQHDVYRDNAEITRADGTKAYVNALEKQYKDYSVPLFADYVLNNTHYNAICKR